MASLPNQALRPAAQLQQLNPANRVCVRAQTTNSGYGQFYVQDIHSPPGEFRLVAGDLLPGIHQARFCLGCVCWV